MLWYVIIIIIASELVGCPDGGVLEMVCVLAVYGSSVRSGQCHSPFPFAYAIPIIGERLDSVVFSLDVKANSIE